MLAANISYKDEAADRFFYSAYGLIVESAMSFPELSSGKGVADVTIEIERHRNVKPQPHSPILCVKASPAQVHLTWGGVGDLLIEQGRRIVVVPEPDADDDALRLFVLGAGLGVLLHQRGLLVLHGSAVAIHDRVVGFIGAKGCGKSTTAAILQGQGHALVADELLVIRFDNQGQPSVIPGTAQIRLWIDALVHSGGDPNTAVRVRPGLDKFNLGAASFITDPLPLHCIYLLDAEGDIAVSPIISSERLFCLIPHLYVSRFGTFFLQSTDAAYSFKQLNALLKQVTIKRLFRQPDLSQSLAIARLIEQDCVN